MKKVASTLIVLTLFTSLYAQKPYKGGEIFSREEVLYGKFEMRMKMIRGSGMISTFYTIGHQTTEDEVYWSEIDIEVLGMQNAQIMATNIFINDPNGDIIDTSKQINLDYSLADDFHTFIIEWTPSYVAWFIDGLEVRRKTGAFVSHMNVPQGYRFNAWISSSPGWVGVVDKDAFPAHQYVDWIEYSSFNGPTQDFTKQWRDDFDSLDSSRWLKANWTFAGNEVDFISDNAYIEDGKLVLRITDPNQNLGISTIESTTNFLAKYSRSNDEIVVHCFDAGNYDTQLYDITGRVLFSKQFNTSDFSIPCSAIKSGVYIIFVTHNGVKSRQKIIIE